MYSDLYNLINHFIFDDAAANLANTDLICTALASIGAVFVIAVPFIIVFKVINILLDI